MLELAGVAADDALLAGWRERVARARARLGWSESVAIVRRHATGASLAIAAPCDQLFVATEINEWALCATLDERDPARWRLLPQALLAAAISNATEPAAVIAPVLAEDAAQARFERLAAAEARPALRALLAAAGEHSLPYVLDETLLTLGAGSGGRDYPLQALPAAGEVPWAALHDVPTAVITGSNGKTTTVRLLAACVTAAGRVAGYSCTDGVFIGAEAQASGDYSGPAGARLVMRDRRTQTAIIEAARGGILRRGIAVSAAHVALVTNISADHFGEYGIHDLDGLAAVKLSVAGLVGRDGLLVLNADDPLLRAGAEKLAARLGHVPPLGWFALHADLALLREHRARGGATCGVRAGVLVLSQAGVEHALGPVARMPLTVDGSATYNLANLAAAALGAAALGIPLDVIATVFARFGADPADNMGRLMRFEVGGVQVLMDYAHNPDGLHGLLEVAQHLRGGKGRLGLILGHAGNRLDADIAALAQVAAQYRPALVVVKENEAHLRGRAPGEIPRLIRAELLRCGLPDSALPMCTTELGAARCALEWSRPGDVLALPVHAAAARAAVLAMLTLESQAAARRGAGRTGPNGTL